MEQIELVKTVEVTSSPATDEGTPTNKEDSENDDDTLIVHVEGKEDEGRFDKAISVSQKKNVSL